MKRRFAALFLASACLPSVALAAPGPIDTQKQMLSGDGPDNAVPWDFTIDGGTRSGEKASIPVPSNWQQQGFGHPHYGTDRAWQTHDRATYHRSFTVPADWQGKRIRLVFDAVMTDTIVKVNGVQAGPLHQGGFNRFSFDITPLLKLGASNDVEVEVAENSANKDTEIAERYGDYWTFGGIYRPVWLEGLPAEAIGHVSVDARADGTIAADITLAEPKTVTSVVGQIVDKDGNKVGTPFSTPIPAGGTGLVTLHGSAANPRLWSSETPNLYFLDVTLFKGNEAVHHVRTRFGFRTFEVRAGDGLYLNGQKIVLKGVNRHSFRPDTGRALTHANSYEDVKLIRGMNMNAVRMSHYSPEESFLEACDELGLYVLDELSGWQHSHDTEVGRKLVRELVERDVNHPAILFWDNGNEGGFNRELDPEYARYDPQHRKVLHPWDPHDGVDTKHYPKYQDFVARLNGPNLVMPTEFQHGLYDGGAGAAMEDVWQAIKASPHGAGGFVWVFADEGLARKDQGGRIDNVGTQAPDGILDARHNPEPSYFTIRDIYAPVQIAPPTLDASFDGQLKLASAYDFTPLSALTFRWEWLRFPSPGEAGTAPRILASGQVAGPDVTPRGEGRLTLPRSASMGQADALRLTARRGEDEVMRWVWPTARPETASSAPSGTPQIAKANGAIRLTAGRFTADFDEKTGLLQKLTSGSRAVPIAGGPRLVYARPAKAEPVWSGVTSAGDNVFKPATPGLANIAQIDFGLDEKSFLSGFTLQVSPDGKAWTTVAATQRTWRDPTLYAFPAQPVAAIRLLDVQGRHGALNAPKVRIGYQADRFEPQATPASTVTSGTGTDPATGKPVVWLDAPGAGGLERAHWTLDASGALRLDYRYQLSGAYVYYGVGFDTAPVAAARALVRGPWPVWKNRLRGPELGVHDLADSKKPGALSPANAGYFADPRWVKLDMGGASLLIRPSSGTPFLQLGARLQDHPNTSPAFPDTSFGFMQAIPAIGDKFHEAADTGPQGQPTDTTGSHEGSLTFTLPAP